MLRTLFHSRSNNLARFKPDSYAHLFATKVGRFSCEQSVPSCASQQYFPWTSSDIDKTTLTLRSDVTKAHTRLAMHDLSPSASSRSREIILFTPSSHDKFSTAITSTSSRSIDSALFTLSVHEKILYSHRLKPAQLLLPGDTTLLMPRPILRLDPHTLRRLDSQSLLCML